MKKIILVSCFIFSVIVSSAQTTYYWVGGNGTASNISFTTNSKWNTSLNGTGTARSASAATDILIVDGTNVGGITLTTGSVTATIGSTSFGQLILRNNATLTLIRPTSGTGTITISGDGTNAEDLLINTGCTLTCTVADSIISTSGNNLLLSATATGRVYGTLTLTGGACRTTASNPLAGGSLFFESGSVCNVNTQITNYPFGNSAGVPNAVVFKDGSKLYYKGGNSIFTNTSTYSPIVFNAGSELVIDANIPNSYCISSNFFAARRFANLTIASGRSVDIDNFSNVDNLTIQNGGSLKLKTTGAFPVSGNIVNNGLMKVNTLLPNVSGTSNIMFKGSSTQTIGGTGTYDTLGVITVSPGANVVLNTDLNLCGLNSTGTSSNASAIMSTLDLNSHVIRGTSRFQTKEYSTATTAVTTGASGANTLILDASAYSGSVNTANVSVGLLVTGTGIPANTYIIGTSSAASTITLSNNNIGTVTSVTISSTVATLKTSNTNGIDGSLPLSGGLALGTGTNYEFNGATTNPFSLSTDNNTGNVVCNAAIKTNKSQIIGGTLTLNTGNFTIRSLDTIRLKSPLTIGGSPFNNSKHIVNEVNAGSIGILRVDSIASSMLLPIGSASNYLPVTLKYSNPTNVYVSAFQGITLNGTVGGTPLSTTELKKVVDAVWNIISTSALATADSMKLAWPQSLEGSSFTSLSNNDIGIINYDGISWGQPLSVGDNTLNNASLINASSGIYGIGSLNQPLVNNFIFDTIPTKTYGDADFTRVASSDNTTQSISYSSSNTAVATISSAGLIHIVGAGTTNITASQQTDGVYPDTSVTRSFIVNKKSLTITANNITRYEGVANPTLTATYSGFVNSEDSSVLLTPVTLSTLADTSSVPGSYPITVTGATSDNYNINMVNGTLTVQSATGLFVFDTIPTKTYGDADFTRTATSQNGVQSITYSSSNTSVATISSAGLIHIVGAGTTNITASQSGNSTYPAASVTRSFVVNKKSLTITANNITRNEGVANPTLTATYSGFVNGEDSSVLLTPATLSTQATSSSPSGDYTITVTGATSNNYDISFVDGTLSVQAAPGAFSFNAVPTKTYGDADFTQTATSQNITQPIIYSSSNTSVATISSAGLIHIVGAGTTNITASQATDGTYPAASVTRGFVVNKKSLTITANNITRYEGVANPTLTATYSGFVNSEDSSVLLTPATLSTTANTSSVPGSYPITVTSATSDNYNINMVNGTLTVQSATGLFVFDTIPTKTYGDADFTRTATSQNVVQSITYSSSNTSVATISSAGLIHIVGAGTTNITASQSGNSTYPAASVTRSFVVNKKSLTITANNLTRNEGVANPTLTATYSGFVNGQDSSVLLTSAVLSTTATTNSVPGSYPITVTGATSDNYNINMVNGTLTVQSATGLFVFDTIPTKTYGDADFTRTATSQNVVQSITYSSSNTSVATISSAGLIHIVGAGTTNITASQSGNSTYPAASVTRSFVVNKKSLTITANNITRNEGVANPTLTATYSGFVNGQDSSVLLTPAVLSTTATTNSVPGSYPITVTGATSNNYNISMVNGTLTVVALPGLITYYWVGGLGAVSAPLSFATSSRWNTRLDGTGVARPSTDTTGILVIDGSNVGGAVPTTGNVYSSTGSTRMSQLILRNGAKLTISRVTTGNGTLYIKGDSTSLDDLVVDAGCVLTLNAADSVSNSSGNKLLIMPISTAKISGTFTLDGGTCRVEQTNPVSGGAFFFENGSVCNVNTRITYYPFGSSNAVNKGVVFKNGSKLVYKGGTSFFRASSSSVVPIVLQQGSICRFEASVPNILSDSSLIFSNRTFSNVEVASNISVNAADFYNIDNLTIESGATFNLKGTGTSPVSGSITNNGTFGAVSGFSSSNLLMKGNVLQTISGSGIFTSLGAISVAAGSNVELNTNLSVNGSATSLVQGKINLKNYAITGTGTLQTKALGTLTSTVSSGAVGTRVLTVPSVTGIYVGMTVSGTGIPAGSYVIATSSSSSSLTISDSAQAAITSITLNGSIPVIQTSNANGVDGSIGAVGSLSLAGATDYIFDGATTQPFSLLSPSNARNVTTNASITTNRSLYIDSMLNLASGILTIRPTDTVRLTNGNDIIGAPFSATKYIVTQNDGSNVGVLRMDAANTNKLYPIGSTANYLPVSVNTANTSTICASVFEGVTNNGEITGTPLTSTQLQPLVNAVWKLNRTAGSGNADVEFAWDASLEGSSFTTTLSPLIGVIQNSNNVWGSPTGTGDNVANTVFANVTGLGSFSIGANPNSQPFVFNAIPAKTYGDADFNTSLYSSNTTQPIVYTSSNTGIATVSSAGLIHIVGAGTCDITATQATDGTHPAANISRTLLVNKADLTITADNKIKIQGSINPPLTITYSGFVLGETEAVLLTPVVISTTAVQSSPVGNYPITVSGATAANYNITLVAGELVVYDQLNFAVLPAKTYGNPDFNTVVTALNTQPFTYSSSNTAIATVSASGLIHIVGAGTCDINVSQASDGTYPAASVNRTLVINKKLLTTRVIDTSKFEGEDNPNFRFVYSGFVLGENESVLTVVPFGNTIANRSSIPGVYVVTPDGAQAANYSFAYTSGLLRIYPKDSSLVDIHTYYSNGALNINVFSPYVDLTDLLLYNVNGQFIQKKNVLILKGLNATKMDVSNLVSGTYVLVYRGKKTMISKTVLIIK